MSEIEALVDKVLNRMYDLTFEKGWCQLGIATNHDGEGLDPQETRVARGHEIASLCIRGMLMYAIDGLFGWDSQPEGLVRRVDVRLAAGLVDSPGANAAGIVVKYNNAPGRTVDDIRALIRRAMEAGGQ